MSEISRKAAERDDEDAVASWLVLVLSQRLLGDGTVYLRGQEYAVEAAEVDVEDSPLMLTRVGDGHRFEAVIEVEAIELLEER
jgi:hypothetical protein